MRIHCIESSSASATPMGLAVIVLQDSGVNVKAYPQPQVTPPDIQLGVYLSWTAICAWSRLGLIMSAGCFSWCPFGRRRDETGSKKENADPALARLGEKSKDVERGGQLVVKSHNQESSINTNAALPTTAQYITATAKQVLELLQSASGVIPVPFLKDAIDVAMKIITLCEGASAVEQKAKELQDRVGHLMIVIVENVTSKNEDGSKEMVIEAARSIESDVQDLVDTLKTINKDLAEIGSQGWVVAFYQQINMDALQDCVNRLSTALERFKLAHDLREDQLIREITSRLQKMADQVDKIADNVVDVSGKIDKLTDKVENIEEVLKRQRQVQITSDAVARHEMPLKPGVFEGRAEVVNEITQFLLKEETSRVCILGPGGMGKTSISLAVAESPLIRSRFLDNIVWVPCIGATFKALFLETLYTQLQMPADNQPTPQKIISELSASTAPRLLIFDNFETPLFASAEGTPKYVEDILRKLAELNHIAMLVTMRGRDPPFDDVIRWQPKNIDPTTEEANLKIFHTINPNSINDQYVPLLLQKLGQMPFAVTLMAKLAKESHSTPKELLESWDESGPDILSDDPERSMNNSIALSFESKLVQGNPDAVMLLSILSLLPTGTTKENLRWWAPTLKKSRIPSAVSALLKTGLLVENKSQDSDSLVLFVVPVVQSFMQQHQRIGEELRQQILSSCCQFIRDHASRFLDSSFPRNSKVLLGEDSNIQAILLEAYPSQCTSFSDEYMEALISFCWYRCDTKPSLDVVNFALSAAQASGNEKHIATLKWCLGRTYHQLGSFPQSYEHLQEAYQLLNEFSSKTPESQQLYGECGIDLTDTARLVIEDPEKLTSLALDVETTCSRLSADLHGRSIMFVGRVLHDQHRQEAMCYLERAKDILQAVGATASLAEVFQSIADVHHSANRLHEAIEAIQEALDEAKKSGSPFTEAAISISFGRILRDANRDTEAWTHFEIALMRSSYSGSRNITAYALYGMGSIYHRRKDFTNACGAFEAAAENFLAVGDDVAQKRCKDYVARAKAKQPWLLDLWY